MGGVWGSGLGKTLFTERVSGQMQGVEPPRLVEVEMDDPLVLLTIGSRGRRGEKNPRLKDVTSPRQCGQ